MKQKLIYSLHKNNHGTKIKKIIKRKKKKNHPGFGQLKVIDHFSIRCMNTKWCLGEYLIKFNT